MDFIIKICFGLLIYFMVNALVSIVVAIIKSLNGTLIGAIGVLINMFCFAIWGLFLDGLVEVKSYKFGAVVLLTCIIINAYTLAKGIWSADSRF